MFKYLILKNRLKGAFLIEVLLTVCVFGILMSFIIRSHLTSLSACVFAEDYAVASLLLENKMKEISQTGYILRDLEETKRFSEPFEKFSYTLQTQEINGREDLQDLNEVILSVTWQARNKEKKLTAATYLFYTL